MNVHPKHETVSDVTSAFEEEIRKLDSDGPYILVGHCLGGIIALDLTARLERAGLCVSKLVLFEALPPQIDRVAGVNSDSKPSASATPVTAESGTAIELAFEQMWSQLAMLPPQLYERFTLFGRDQIEMVGRQTVSPVEAPIVLFHTDTHPVEVFNLWDALSQSGCEKIQVSGNAFSMLEPPNLAKIASCLELSLRRA